jgi:hypothetical protein
LIDNFSRSFFLGVDMRFDRLKASVQLGNDDAKVQSGRRFKAR